MARVASKLVSSILRACQIVFAAVRQPSLNNKTSQNLILYQVVLAIEIIYVKRAWDKAISEYGVLNISILTLSMMSVVVAWLFLAPSMSIFKYFLLDFVLALCWFIVFGFTIAKFDGDGKCGHDGQNVSTIATGGRCNERRAIWGFSFLSGCVWIASFLVGFWVVVRERKLASRKAMPLTTAV